MVALDAAILMHPQGLGGVGPPRGLHATRSCSASASASSAGARTTCARPSRRASSKLPRSAAATSTEPRQFNLMFETNMGPVAGRGLRGLPAPRDRPGHLRQLQERAPVLAQEAAVRHRADRQVVPQRDHAAATSSSARASSSRWRSSSSCRPPRRRSWYERWTRVAARLVRRSSASGPTTCSCASTTPTSCRTTRARTADIEYLFPMGWSELEGIANRGDFDLTQHAEFSGEKLEYVDSATRRPLRAPRDRALGRRRPRHARVHGRRLRRGGGRGPRARAAAPAPAPGAGEGGRAAAREQGRPARDGARTIYEELRKRMPAEFDTGGSIGKRYRRQDEIGTPWGVTVDHQTMEDDTVTLRDRDSLDAGRASRSTRWATSSSAGSRPPGSRRSWLPASSRGTGSFGERSSESDSRERVTRISIASARWIGSMLWSPRSTRSLWASSSTSACVKPTGGSKR